jgi:hypothetical protein
LPRPLRPRASSTACSSGLRMTMWRRSSSRCSSLSPARAPLP